MWYGVVPRPEAIVVVPALILVLVATSLGIAFWLSALAVPYRDVAHALGVGVAFDVAWFSFVERTMIRLDVAQTINSSAPLQFNFYFQHPF